MYAFYFQVPTVMRALCKCIAGFIGILKLFSYLLISMSYLPFILRIKTDAYYFAREKEKKISL